MSKQKLKNNQFGSFHIKSRAYSTKKRWFLYSILLLVLVSAGGISIHKKITNKNVEQAITKAEEGILPGWWIQDYFGSSVCESEVCGLTEDPDDDGLTNEQEFHYKTNPFQARTVEDEMTDGELVAHGFDPSRSGRKTFDQVMSEALSDEKLLDEGLVFESEIRNLVAESLDLTQINLPLVHTSELNLTQEQSKEVYTKYFDELESTTQKYFSKTESLELSTALESGSNFEIQLLSDKARVLAEELKEMTVPATFADFHKYMIALYELMPEVLMVPALDTTSTNTVAVDRWYDKAQAFMAIQQKLYFEQQVINKAMGR